MRKKHFSRSCKFIVKCFVWFLLTYFLLCLSNCGTSDSNILLREPVFVSDSDLHLDFLIFCTRISSKIGSLLIHYLARFFLYTDSEIGRGISVAHPTISHIVFNTNHWHCTFTYGRDFFSTTCASWLFISWFVLSYHWFLTIFHVESSCSRHGPLIFSSNTSLWSDHFFVRN